MGELSRKWFYVLYKKRVMVSLVEIYHVYEMNLYDGQEEQQKEHEEEMRARLRRSESIEKAAVSVLSSLSYL